MGHDSTSHGSIPAKLVLTAISGTMLVACPNWSDTRAALHRATKSGLSDATAALEESGAYSRTMLGKIDLGDGLLGVPVAFSSQSSSLNVLRTSKCAPKANKPLAPEDDAQAKFAYHFATFEDSSSTFALGGIPVFGAMLGGAALKTKGSAIVSVQVELLKKRRLKSSNDTQLVNCCKLSGDCGAGFISAVAQMKVDSRAQAVNEDNYKTELKSLGITDATTLPSLSAVHSRNSGSAEKTSREMYTHFWITPVAMSTSVGGVEVDLDQQIFNCQKKRGETTLRIRGDLDGVSASISNGGVHLGGCGTSAQAACTQPVTIKFDLPKCGSFSDDTKTDFIEVTVSRTATVDDDTRDVRTPEAKKIAIVTTNQHIAPLQPGDSHISFADLGSKKILAAIGNWSEYTGKNPKLMAGTPRLSGVNVGKISIASITPKDDGSMSYAVDKKEDSCDFGETTLETDWSLVQKVGSKDVMVSFPHHVIIDCAKHQ